MGFKKGKATCGEYAFCRYLLEKEYGDLKKAYPTAFVNKKSKDPIEASYQRFNEAFLTFLYEMKCKQRKEPKDIVISKQILARFAGIQSNKMSAASYLTRFKNDVMPDFSWTEYFFDLKSGIGKARTVATLNFKPFICWLGASIAAAYKLLNRKERKEYIRYTRLIDIHTGLPLSRSRSKATQISAIKKRLVAQAHTLTQTVLDYQNNKRLAKYYHNLCKENFEQIQDSYDYLFDLNAKKPENNRTPFLSHPDYLIKLLAMPFGGYTHVNSTRAIPIGYTHLARVPKLIRQAFFQGCYEADLASIQLAALAEMLVLDNVKQQLASLQEKGLKIWDYLISKMPAGDYEQQKSAIKTSLYSLCFGAGNKTMKKPFRALGKGYTNQYNAFISTPIIRDLRAARDFKLGQIVETSLNDQRFATKEDYKNYVMRLKRINSQRMSAGKEPRPKHSFKYFRIYKAAKKSRSLLSLEAQEIEQIVMSAIYEAANEELEKPQPRWRILLYLYDGVIIKINDSDPKRAKGIINRLQSRVSSISDDIYKSNHHPDEYTPPSEIITRLEVSLISKRDNTQ